MITQQNIDEIIYMVEHIQRLFQDLIIGGLRTATQDRLNAIQSMRDEFERIGAVHIAEHLDQLAKAMMADSPEAASILMRAQARVHLLERILTIEMVEGALAQVLDPSHE